jgi:uracil-DNA glycosylase family 4
MGLTCDCPLRREIEVPYSGARDAAVAFVGESPGREERIARRPFIGRAGRLLRESAEKARLSVVSSVILNSARCLIDKAELSEKVIRQILAACRPSLETALQSIAPKVIVALGNIALTQLLRKSGIKKYRGKFLWSEEFKCWIMPTFHPAYCLRDPTQTPFLVQDLEKVRALQEHGWVLEEVTDETDYREVQDLNPLFEDQNQEYRIALDTETTGVDYLDSNTLMVCASFSWEKGKAVVLRFHEESLAPTGLVIQQLRKVAGARVKQLVPVNVRQCDNFDAKVSHLWHICHDPRFKLYMQNGLFDLHIIREFFLRLGMEPPDFPSFVMDTQTAAHVLDENLYQQVSLYDLQGAFTDLQSDYKPTFSRNHSYEDMLTVPVPDLVSYAAGDADVTRRAGMTLRGKLFETQKLARYYGLFVQPTMRYALYELEVNGSMVDLARLPIAKEETAQLLAVHEKAIESLIPAKIRAAATAQKKRISPKALLADALFSDDGYRLRSPKKTKSGQPSADKDSRAALLDSRIPERARKLLTTYDEWSELSTLYTRYLSGFEKHVKSDGHIHSRFSLVRAATGRVASREPNMMNNPKRSNSSKVIRRLLCAPPGWVLVEIDASQAELRWMAQLSQDREMIRIYRNDLDIHTETTEAMLGKKKSQVAPEEFAKARRSSKFVNFGVIYLISAHGLVQQCKKEFNLDYTEKQAQGWIRTWFNKYPGVKDYHARTIEFCKRFGYVESPLGRRRRLPNINSRDRVLAGQAERMAVNHPIQSASSDTVLMSITEMVRRKVFDPTECRVTNFIHDSVVLEIREDVIDKNVLIAKEIMENPPLEQFGIVMSVPLKVDAKAGRNLGEMVEVKL